MRKFEPKSVAILGRQPELGLAELESVYGAGHIQPIFGAALLDIEAGEINFKRIGGAIKIAQILATLPTTSWPKIEKYLLEKVPPHLKAKKGKFTLGLSAYGLTTSPSEINKAGLIIKKAAKRPMRIVPNKELALNSASVLHNKLTTQGAWELLLIKNGPETILAQTFFVQDIEDYAARDQARPKRDARVGMLPPKLAQIIVNLAMGAPELKPVKRGGAKPRLSRCLVLDPFCGTGVIIQEALLMGYSVIGTDLDPRMVDYTQQNLRWLYGKHPQLQGHTNVELADATNHQWQIFSAVATEAYLGRPLSSLPAPAKLEEIIQDVSTITKKFLKNLHKQMRPDCKAALALPAWQTSKDRFRFLPVIDEITDMGYNKLKFKHVGQANLVYYRPDQIVARQIIVLKKDK